jgi:hypothetical protein
MEIRDEFCHFHRETMHVLRAKPEVLEIDRLTTAIA